MSSVLNRLTALEKSNPPAPSGTREWHHLGAKAEEHNCDLHGRCYMTSQPINQPVRFMRIIEGDPE